MRKAIGNEKFPGDWPVIADLLPPASLQSHVDPGQEIYYLRAKVSEGGSTLEKSIVENGITITPATREVRHSSINFGDGVNTEERRSIKEIMEIINSYDQPDAVINKRGIVHQPTSRMLSKFDFLDGVEEIHHFDYDQAYQRRMANILCPSPRSMIKETLVLKGIIESNAPELKRIHGTLMTGSLGFAKRIDQKMTPLGWFDLLKNKDNATALQEALRGHLSDDCKFWQDLAIPKEFEVKDGIRKAGRIYLLEDRKKLLGVR